MVRISGYGRFANNDQNIALTRAIGMVGDILGNNSDCAGLLGGTIPALRTLAQASFSYANTAIRPPNTSDADWATIQGLPTSGFAAGTMIGRPIAFLTDNFFVDPNDVSGMATILIHEMMHMQGKRGEIDVQNPGASYGNYAEISQRCGTRDSSR